jgi:hypothetical protein
MDQKKKERPLLSNAYVLAVWRLLGSSFDPETNG